MKKFLLFSLVLGQKILADPLNQTQLYYRCYAQLTNERPKANDPNLSKIANGSLSAISACSSLLDQATIGSDGLVASDVGKKILSTLHNFHSTWMGKRSWEFSNVYFGSTGMQDVYEGTDDAFFFTKAMFIANGKYSDVLTRREMPVPIRSNPNPGNGNNTTVPLHELQFTGDFAFAPLGTLLGVATKTETLVNHPQQNDLPLYTNIGGGMLGSPRYILNNVGFTEYDVSLPSYGAAYDAIKMPRLWGRALFHDFLCRDIPVITADDAAAFVVNDADAAFRKTSGCTACHASMDRVASLIRNIKLRSIQDRVYVSFLATRPVTESSEDSWPAKSDPVYANRPPQGTFYFRDYKGNLQDTPLASLDELGQVIASLDDFYICAASRYFTYFMGATIPVAPYMGNDQTNPELSAAQNKVISLGLKLKETQSLKELVKDIMKLPEYGQSDFGVSP